MQKAIGQSEVKVCWLFIVLALCVASTAQGASFDCAKATTKVERMICGDAELSKLDEELTATYKTALQDEKQAETVRQAQKNWLKERNGCSDADCVKRAYETRLTALAITDQSADSGKAEMPPIPQASKAKAEQEGTAPVAAKLRYTFCDKDKPELYCEGQTGKGYTVCEAYLKHLNSLTEPPTCEAPIPPGFKRPDWEEMDIMQHLDLAYQAEKIFMKKLGGYQHPDFDTWRQTFLKEVQDGLIAPRMRKAKVTPNDRGDATILAYTRDRDSCRKTYASEDRREIGTSKLPGGYWDAQGDAHFTLSENSPFTVQEIVNRGSLRQTDLVLYAGRPYLVWVKEPFAPLTKLRNAKTIKPMDKSELTVFAFDPRLPDRSRPSLDLTHYLVNELCQFVPY